MSENMNCGDIQARINDYCDAALSPLMRQAMDRHIEYCDTCSDKINQRKQMMAILKSIPRPQASAELFQRIVKAHTVKRSKNVMWFSAGFASAIAACIVVAVLVLMRPFATIENQLPTVTAISNQVSQIQFVVHSEKAFENVRFSVQIPPGLQLEGYAGLQELAWNGKLLQGDNLLSLPVVAQKTLPGVLIMRVDYQNASKEYRVRVNVKEEQHLS